MDLPVWLSCPGTLDVYAFDWFEALRQKDRDLNLALGTTTITTFAWTSTGGALSDSAIYGTKSAIRVDLAGVPEGSELILTNTITTNQGHRLIARARLRVV
jgi:hypothetical protein